MTTPPVDDERSASQREVQRRLGRCLLRLQQCEKLVKAIVAHHEIAGPAHALEPIRAERVADAATKTLGTLVGQLVGSYIVAGEVDPFDEGTSNEPSDVMSVRMRSFQSMSPDNYARAETNLKDLVRLRNRLVHQFIDQHDLWSLEGCRAANATLLAAYSRIDEHFEQLRRWAEDMAQVQRRAANSSSRSCSTTSS